MMELFSISKENKEYGFTFTPLFLINFQFPNKYDKEDIFHFIDELSEDEQAINKTVSVL